VDYDVYIKETDEGFGRGGIVIIVVNVLMISLMTAGFMVERNQKKKDAGKKGEEIEMGRDDYALAKQENSAEVKQPRKILKEKSEVENSDVKLAIFETPNDGVV
jgi:hypothetical protein